MKTILAIFIFCFSFLHGMSKAPEVSPPIVFIHLGPKLPPYLTLALEQAREFNPNSPIYLVASEISKQDLSLECREKVTFVATESLPKDPLHEEFLAKSAQDRTFRGGFWIFTTERFFYLYDFLVEYKLKDVFHLENDVLLYTDLTTLFPTFKKNYKGMIAATFDNDKKGVAGFLYVANPTPLHKFLDFVVEKAHLGGQDMERLGQFKNKYHKKYIDFLPIVMPEYSKDHKLVNRLGKKAKNPKLYSRYFTEFNSIFDAAALGQYLGGIDPQNDSLGPGFVNEACVFDASRFQYLWEVDEKGRKIPFLLFKDKKYRVNNLHIHSKNLAEFVSKASFSEAEIVQ
ncbi:MAG TPA: hypothetical protein VLG44_07865 [Chlamydiales bacterium]|nr:hypothetical protein [Chlamydiales bacterium]